MLSLIQKISTSFKRKQTAAQWGLKFNRVADFTLPTSVTINQKQIPLSLPRSEKGITSEFVDLIFDDCYHLKKWQKKLDPHCKILDIGGNIGLFSFAARQFFPEATIHTYEPNPNLEPYLKHQATVAHFDYFMEAIGAKDGKIKLDLSEKGVSVHSVSHPDETGDIPMLSLDHAIEKLGTPVDLLKMDCEGAEWDILQASDAWKKVLNVELEYHLFQKGQTLAEIQQMIEQLGFVILECKPVDQYYGNLTATRNP